MCAVFSQCGGVEDEFVAFLLSPGCSRAPAVAFVGRELRGGQSKELTADSTRPSLRCARSTSSSTASTATSRQRAWTSYGKFLRLSPLVPLRLGAPTSGSLSSLWLAKKIENLAVDTILAQRLQVSAPARAERQHDFFSGFCGETEEEHQETMSLVKVVQDDQAFGFVYSSARRRTPTAA